MSIQRKNKLNITSNMYALKGNNLYTAFLWSLFLTYTFCDNSIAPASVKNGSASDIVSTILRSNFSLPPYAVDNSSQKILPPSKHSQNTTSNQQVFIAEGGSVMSTVGTHSGREHVSEPPVTKAVMSKSIESNNGTLTKSEIIKPIHEEEVPPQHDYEKPSVPKKGVSFPDLDIPPNHSLVPASNGSMNTGSNINIPNKTISNLSGANVTKINSSADSHIIYKKPLITEADSDYIDITKNGKEDISKEYTIAIDQTDLLFNDEKNNQSDYIVPIVAVILSVPLVAILISLLYKRGTDWWQHRNYKRMDFLIEGIYHD